MLAMGLAGWVSVMLVGAVDAPISAVTVYSDRARVTRTAHVSPHGTLKVELPLLPDSVDPSTVRLTAKGARVERIDLGHVDADDFPSAAAKKLLDALDDLDDQVRLAVGEQQAALAVMRSVEQIQPQLPAGDAQHPLPRLDPAGWGASIAFVTHERDALQARARAASIKADALHRQEETLLEKARALGVRRAGGYRVTATVTGHGQATLSLTYLARRAAWRPVYDLTLDPDRGQVGVAFAAQVTQQTGEDWDRAALTLSTAVPATATRLPKLTTWKIGARDRFIPVATPAPERVSPPPQAVPPPEPVDLEALAVRQRLAARLSQGIARTAALDDSPAESAVGDADVLGGAVGRGGLSFDERKPAPPAPPRQSSRRYAPAKPSAEPVPSAVRAKATADAPRGVREEEDLSLDQKKARGRAGAGASFGLSPPPSYVAPRFAPDTAVALAGGYDLTFQAVQPASIQSGGGAKRVALFARTWPVRVERKLFPALAPDAYLVAELQNPEATALPGGHANLFVGRDPAGTAQLQVVAPGEPFTLPLGIDRALRPVRNVKVVEAEKGLFGKDRVRRYDVTDELANPYAVPITVKLYDQFPVTDDAHVEAKLLSTAPYAAQDLEKGTLEWDLTLPPHGKTQVAFTYSLRTPTDYRLHQ